jgi:hypothetical protein
MNMMKKPYIKKFSEISGFKVWIVDGEYIRDNIDEEFTNFGQHYKFKFIPKNELWIDKERVPGEEKFFISYLLIENRLMAKGMSYSRAVGRGNIFERGERGKSKVMKKRIRLKGDHKKLMDIIHKDLLQKYSTKKVKVWIVDGEAVRGLFYVDFTEGGHGYVYDFIPKDEVWIDDDIEPDEIKFVLLHEMHERALMAKGMKYDPSHASSSKIEYFCRKHKGQVNKKLKIEIKKNSGG